MTGNEFLDLMERSRRRAAVAGTLENGIIVGLDLEGRLFTVMNGRVLSRVVSEAILERSDRNRFLNPGGDALWPGPEGTRFGYEYATGVWRVPPSITGAVWLVRQPARPERGTSFLEIEAEVDLVNSLQVGLPVLLRRRIECETQNGILVQRVTETIRYLGTRTLGRDEFLLVPWSLCQFDYGEGSVYRFPLNSKSDRWDFYAPSEKRQKIEDGICEVAVPTDERFQIGIGENVPCVEYFYPGHFKLTRYIEGDIDGRFSDIADADSSAMPSDRGTKFSVYCDPSGFTEVEACGGSLDRLEPGYETSVTIVTKFEVL